MIGRVAEGIGARTRDRLDGHDADIEHCTVEYDAGTQGDVDSMLEKAERELQTGVDATGAAARTQAGSSG